MNAEVGRRLEAVLPLFAWRLILNAHPEVTGLTHLRRIDHLRRRLLHPNCLLLLEVRWERPKTFQDMGVQ